MVVKTFRGLLANGGQEKFRLSTIKGKVGYKVVKFQLLQEQPGALSSEHVVKIYKTEQTSIDGIINFTDSDLLGACFHSGSASAAGSPEDTTVIFDNEIFNQDIFVTHSDAGGFNVNYYIELEVIPLDDAGAEYTTLKDMRQ